MADRYEYYNTGDGSGAVMYAQYWAAQTFTPSAAHIITSVKLKLYRFGSPGTLTISIRATSEGKPTGNDLATGTTNGNNLPVSSPYEWREIALGNGCELSSGIEYAIVVRALNGSGFENAKWRLDNSSPTYASGTYTYSNNSGSSWSVTAGSDFLFEDWGTGFPISNTINYKWHVKALVNDTPQLIWNVRKLVDKAIQFKWD
ncbi:hypothetical protein LCGC14_2561800, partial [marine sediment metagenome]